MRMYSCCIVAAMSLCSCATIFSGSRKIFGIDSSPAAATVEITDRRGVVVYHGQTPVTTKLNTGAGFFKSATYEIKLTMNGYQTKIIPVQAHINGWYFGNLVIGGVIGMLIVDPATGAMYKFSDTDATISATLTPNATSAIPGIRIIDLRDVPAEERGKLVKLPG